MDVVNRLLCSALTERPAFCSSKTSLASVEWLLSDNGQLFASTLLGAVVGAAAGGLIQYLISSHEFARERAKDADVERQRHKATALEISVKAITLNNQLYSLMGLILRMFEAAEAKGYGHARVYEKMVPMSGIAKEPIQFTANELALLFGAKENELANHLMLLNEKVRSLTDAVLKYSELRYAFRDAVFGDNPQAVAVRATELEDLASQVCVGIVEDFEFCTQVADEIAPAIRRALGEDEFLTLKIVPGAPKSIDAFKMHLAAHNLTASA